MQRPDQANAGGLLREEMSRFAREIHRVLPWTALSWSERSQVHRDLEALVLEARHGCRVELLTVLVGCVESSLETSRPAPRCTALILDARSALSRAR